MTDGRPTADAYHCHKSDLSLRIPINERCYYILQSNLYHLVHHNARNILRNMTRSKPLSWDSEDELLSGTIASTVSLLTKSDPRKDLQLVKE